MTAPTPKLVVTVDAHEWTTRFQGAYSATANYVPGQIVEKEEGFYSCIVATVNHAPPNTAFWVFLGGI